MVKHRTLATVTDSPDHILWGQLHLLLKGRQPSDIVSSESFRITRALRYDHIDVALGISTCAASFTVWRGSACARLFVYARLPR